MELRIFTEPQQGATYEDLLAVARVSEESGFGGFFRSDHYLKMGDGDPGPGPTDAWTTLAGLARDTSRIRLGTLLTAGTFRHPGSLAVIAAQVDAMSGGRVELGLGAGWFEEEHRAFAIPFPSSLGERLDRLEEQLEVITGMWATAAGERFDHDGPHYRLVDNFGLPKPAQRPRPPIIVGGVGVKRMPALAARFADECNVPFSPAERCREVFAALDVACEAKGRDGSELVRSAALVVCCGVDESEVARRAAAIRRPVADLRRDGVAGTPLEVAERLADYEAAGVSRAYLQVLDLSDLEHLRLIAAEVAPLVA